MRDTLKWRLTGELFEDGSQLSDWQKIEQSHWQWQYDTYELAFDIYEHDGEFQPRDLEWVRTYEYDDSIHRIVKAGEHTPSQSARSEA